MKSPALNSEAAVIDSPFSRPTLYRQVCNARIPRHQLDYLGDTMRSTLLLLCLTFLVASLPQSSTEAGIFTDEGTSDIQLRVSLATQTIGVRTGGRAAINGTLEEGGILAKYSAIAAPVFEPAVHGVEFMVGGFLELSGQPLAE